VTWLPLTPAVLADWQAGNKTLYFRDERGQMGFGTYDLAKAMGLKPVEWSDIG
jgi:hypothetical protein